MAERVRRPKHRAGFSSHAQSVARAVGLVLKTGEGVEHYGLH